MAALSGMCALRRVVLLHSARNTKTLSSLDNRRRSPLLFSFSHRNSSVLSAHLLSCRHQNVPTSNLTFSFIRPFALQNCLYSQTPPGFTDEILKSKQSPPQNENVNSEPKGQQKGSDDKKKSFFNKYGVWLGLASISLGISGFFIQWGLPARGEDGKEIPDEFSDLPWWKGYWQRSMKQATVLKKSIEEPSSQKLLPDPLQEPWYQPPYTLVLELTGVLVNPEWTFGTGWRFKKRPAVEYFLQQVGPPLFEVVIYTREAGFTAFPIVDGLDPNGYVSFRLFRDATRYVDGVHVKDLDCLNRDLTKVILVDCEPKAYEKHSRNAVGLKKWTGDEGDRTLIDLANFLRTIGTSGVEDVRTVLDHYNEFDDPLEAFKENQRKLQEFSEAREAMKSKEEKKLPSLYTMGLTGRRR